MSTTVRKTLPIHAKRKQYYAKLKDDLRVNQSTLKRLENTIESLTITTSASKDLEWTTSQIANARQRIKHLQEEGKKIEGKIFVVIEGGCDTEIETLYKTNVDHVQEIDEKKAKRDAIAAARDERNAQIGNKFSKSEYTEMKNERYMQKVWDREYDRFTEVSSQMPDYMARSLATMPNNKGYKWRGIIFYGMLADDNGPCVVFEKKPDGTIISECTSTSFQEWFKPKEGTKQSLRSHRRQLNFRAPATLS